MDPIQKNGLKDVKNVQTYFYRFEFQERGTVHLHMLVWLKKMDKIIKADCERRKQRLEREMEEFEENFDDKEQDENAEDWFFYH